MVLERHGPVKRKPPIVVHMGNVGLGFIGETPAHRTSKFASRFRGIHFFGIDLRKWIPETSNWEQHQTDLIGGLKKLKNNSVSLITSEMTLGYYGEGRLYPRTAVAGEDTSMSYAKKVLDVARRKLKKGGKILITIDSKRAKKLVLQAHDAGFLPGSIKEVKIKKTSSSASYWTRQYSVENKKVGDTDMVCLELIKK